MENNLIHQLLAKYFEGTTSLEEERVLIQYFTSEQPAETEWILYKRHFEMMNSSKVIKESDLLESKIMSRIEHFENSSRPGRDLFSIRRFILAASIIIAIVISGVMIIRSQSNRLKDTYTDPQLAYIETQRALLYISAKMNKGIEPLSNISKINSGAKQLKNLEKIDESLGMLNLVSFINQSSNMKK